MSRGKRAGVQKQAQARPILVVYIKLNVSEVFVTL